MVSKTARRKTSKNKMFTRKTEKGKGIVMTIEFPEDIAKCEKTLKNGMNSLVAFKAKWCGACHQFNDGVWNSLTKMKNRNMNLISVDSEIAPKVIRIMNMKSPEYYPTLTVTGKDGKAASFKDENGNSTNAMPRQNSLPEDKAFLSQLLTSKSPNSIAKVNLDKEKSVPRALSTPNTTAKINSLARSPFTETVIPSISETANRSVRVESVRSVGPSQSIADDLVASQSGAPRSPTATSGVIGSMKGGRMLRAIKQKTASLKAMLRQTYKTVTRRRSRK
jgi:hypothetical protein